MGGKNVNFGDKKYTLHLRCWRQHGSTSDYSVWQSNFSLGASSCHLVQFNWELWGDMEVTVYIVIVKSYFTRRSRFLIELSATKLNSFQCKATFKKSSILDIADVPDTPLITIIGKVTFNLMHYGNYMK